MVEWDLHKNVWENNIFQGVLGTFDVEEIINDEDNDDDQFGDDCGDDDDDVEEYSLMLEGQAISIVEGRVQYNIFFGSFKACQRMKEALEYSLS